MKVIGIIPARYGSTRLTGKPLIQFHNKPLIQITYEAIVNSKLFDSIFIATESEIIKKKVMQFGGQCIMTSKEAKNGTERCAEAIEHINYDCDIVVNFQGDAPLTPEWFIEDLIEAFNENTDTQIATPVLRLDGALLNAFKLDRRSGRVGGTTVVFDNEGNALYFSKEIIPYFDKKRLKRSETYPIFHHVGVYAYRRKPLLNYNSWKESNLELLEGLEQLRFLENGYSIKCVPVDSKGRTFWELNNPEDVARIEKEINKNIA